MITTPFHAMCKAKELANYTFHADMLLPVYASSDIKIYPYQIAAAMFAMRSPYLKGVVLCDEGSLGKTYEALIIIAQKYYAGNEKIIVIVPTSLLQQWSETIENHFTIPFFTIDSDEKFSSYCDENNDNPFSQDGVILTTYDFAVEKASYIEQITWGTAVFEEAHRLRKIYDDKNDNKESSILKNSVGEAFKILLTATPMQNDIMDLYGLIYFIDETVFPDADEFYKRYFRKPENYAELGERVSKYCFRTMRKQVQNYVKIPERISVGITYTPTAKETKIYDMAKAYLQRAVRSAYPKMDEYELTLMFYKTLSSSTFAFEKILQSAMKRVIMGTDEYEQLNDMLTECKKITVNAKGVELIKTLNAGFSRLKKTGAEKKAIVFTENRTTQKYLTNLLKDKYTVVVYNGDKTRDYSVIKKFKDDAEILIATDIAAEGFNLEFCSFVINYDLPYNVLTIEQRINRCHRQEQNNDVFSVTFLNKNNFADVRMLELINKRTLQFNGVIGLSDNVIGNIGADAKDIFETSRTKAEIQSQFEEVLAKNEVENKEIVSRYEDALFTTFSKEIAEHISVVPKYIKAKIEQLNTDLWYVTKYFFNGKVGVAIDDDTRTIRTFAHPPKVFTGARLGRNEYSMSPEYKPKSGRHTLTGSLAKNILKEISWQGIPDSGTVTVEKSNICFDYKFPVKIGFYEVKVKEKSAFMGGCSYYVFTGKTSDGIILTDKECREIMDMTVISETHDGRTYGQKDGIIVKQKNPLDEMIKGDEFIQKTIAETLPAEKEEADRLRTQANRKKAMLEQNIAELRHKSKEAANKIQNVNNRLEKLAAQKCVAEAERDLKRAEQNLFMDKLRVDAGLEEDIKVLMDKTDLQATVKREFIIQVIAEE